MACRLAVEIASVESGPYNHRRQVRVARDEAELVERYFGDQTEVRASLEDHESPLRCEKARRAFGYAPRYVWRPHRSFEE